MLSGQVAQLLNRQTGHAADRVAQLGDSMQQVQSLDFVLGIKAAVRMGPGRRHRPVALLPNADGVGAEAGPLCNYADRMFDIGHRQSIDKASTGRKSAWRLAAEFPEMRPEKAFPSSQVQKNDSSEKADLTIRQFLART